MDDLERRFMAIVADVFKADPDTLTGSTRFVEDLRARSLTMVAFVAAVESEFGIRTTARENNQNKTLDQAIEYVRSKVADKKKAKLAPM